MHTQRVKAETGNGADVADAGLTLPSCSGGEIDLLEKSQLADECLCLGNGIGPVAGSVLYPAVVKSVKVSSDVGIKSRAMRLPSVKFSGACTPSLFPTLVKRTSSGSHCAKRRVCTYGDG